MVQIIPSILAEDEHEFLDKLARIRNFAPLIHVDVMDGIFVPYKCWADPEHVRHLLGHIPFEVHLMVSEPEHAVPLWLACGASRVIFHAEATKRDHLICRATAADCANLAVAINIETPLSKVVKDDMCIKQLTIMAVPPGRGGQPFQPTALEKVRAAKSKRPELIIEVDGGVKLENAERIVEAGASRLVVGSAVTGAPDPQAAYLAFEALLNSPSR